MIAGLGVLSVVAPTATAGNYHGQSVTTNNHVHKHVYGQAYSQTYSQAKTKSCNHYHNNICRKHVKAQAKYRQKFTVENGVRVYRGDINARRAANQARIIYGMRLQQQKQFAEAARIKQARKRQAAYERGYEKGFDKGYIAARNKLAQRRKIRRNPYNYGRRYSTSFYGYPLSRRFTFSPYMGGYYRSFR